MQDSTYSFPADLPLSELESRLAERLRSQFDLQDVHVTMNERGQAAVTAAPSSAGVSSRLSRGNRAVSVDTVIPSGIGRGDVVSLIDGQTSIDGTVLSAKSGPLEDDTPPADNTPESEKEVSVHTQKRAPTTTGGEGRITVSVPVKRVTDVLRSAEPTLLVQSRGIRREFELISVLRESGQRIRRFTIGELSAVAGRSIREASPRTEYGVAILALRREGEWMIGPRGEAVLTAGTEVFVVGSMPALNDFETVVVQ
jgi:K+/H+ antiporter YhaU regulatory subunit KhtT